MSAPTVTVVLADLLAERAEQLRATERRLRAFAPSDKLPPHRLLQLAAETLGMAGDLEVQLHKLAGWLPAEPAP